MPSNRASEEEIAELELNTRFDIDGDGTKGFHFQTELLNSGGSNTQRLRLSDTSAGLALYDNARAPIHGEGTSGDDISGFPVPTNSTATTTGVIQLLDSSFAIPTGSSPVYARLTTEWQVTTQFPAGGDVATGYELFTQNGDTVSLHRFDSNGTLLSSTELSTVEKLQTELRIGIDFSSNSNNLEIDINSKLTPEALNSSRRIVYETDKGLLVSTTDGLEVKANPFENNLAAAQATLSRNSLLLNDAGNAAFSIPGGDNGVIQTVVRRKEFNRTSSVAAPTISTRGLRPLHPRCQQRC